MADSVDKAPDDVFQTALSAYPVLRNLPLSFYQHFGQSNDSRVLELWPPNEAGTGGQWRPSQLPINTVGVEVLSQKTRPIDILGDVTSHYLVNIDETVKGYYDKFKDSLTDSQKQRLMDQYRHAQRYENEQRAYDTWEKQTGLPAYFRGYAFQQWPQDFNEKAYTKDQRDMFDNMINYLSGKQK